MNDVTRPAVRRRLHAWRVVVVIALVADAIVACSGSAIAAAVATLSLVAMLALLATTPADAIVLPRSRSERVLLIGATTLYAIAWGAGGSATVAIGAIVVDVALIAACRRAGVSAWWAALFAWQPIVLIATRYVSIAHTPG